MLDELTHTGPALPMVAILLFLAVAAVGVFAAETRRQRLLCVAKPLATLLLLAIVGPPHTGFARWIAAGIAFSLAGDVALLFASNRAFLLGLGAFLVAHGLYATAFLSKARFTGRVWLFAAGLVVATAWLLRRLWPGTAGMRAPVTVYGLAIATMAVSAFATTSGGALSPTASACAAIGAVLFFVSDSTLALSKFERPLPHSALATLGVYWLGQLGIALAAYLA